MRKEIMIYVACLVTVITCYWICWREIPCKKVSECPGGVSNAQEMAFKSDWDKESRVRELQDNLKYYEKGILDFERQTIWDMKDELARLTGTGNPVKVYAGEWKKGYLEVTK